MNSYNDGVRAENKRITELLEASLTNKVEVTDEQGNTKTTYFFEIDEVTCQQIKENN